MLDYIFLGNSRMKMLEKGGLIEVFFLGSWVEVFIIFVVEM